MSCSFAISAMASKSSLSIIPPVGLWGEFRIISRVREVMDRLTSSRSGLNPSSSYRRMGTGVAPENLIIDS